MSLSRNVTGREFQRHGPAMEKLLSPRHVHVLFVAHVKTSADHSDRQPMSVKSWQSSASYCGSCGVSKSYLVPELCRARPAWKYNIVHSIRANIIVKLDGFQRWTTDRLTASDVHSSCTTHQLTSFNHPLTSLQMCLNIGSSTLAGQAWGLKLVPISRAVNLRVILVKPGSRLPVR